jgi:hypothetical protein
MSTFAVSRGREKRDVGDSSVFPVIGESVDTGGNDGSGGSGLHAMSDGFRDEVDMVENVVLEHPRMPIALPLKSHKAQEDAISTAVNLPSTEVAEGSGSSSPLSSDMPQADDPMIVTRLTEEELFAESESLKEAEDSRKKNLVVKGDLEPSVPAVGVPEQALPVSSNKDLLMHPLARPNTSNAQRGETLSLDSSEHASPESSTRANEDPSKDAWKDPSEDSWKDPMTSRNSSRADQHEDPLALDSVIPGHTSHQDNSTTRKDSNITVNGDVIQNRIDDHGFEQELGCSEDPCTFSGDPSTVSEDPSTVSKVSSTGPFIKTDENVVSNTVPGESSNGVSESMVQGLGSGSSHSLVIHLNVNVPGTSEPRVIVLNVSLSGGEVVTNNSSERAPCGSPDGGKSVENVKDANVSKSSSTEPDRDARPGDVMLDTADGVGEYFDDVKARWTKEVHDLAEQKDDEEGDPAGWKELCFCPFQKRDLRKVRNTFAHGCSDESSKDPENDGIPSGWVSFSSV